MKVQSRNQNERYYLKNNTETQMIRSYICIYFLILVYIVYVLFFATIIVFINLCILNL